MGAFERIPTAEEARRASDGVGTQRAEDLLAHLADAITRAIQRGDRCVQVPCGSRVSSVEAAIISKGYGMTWRSASHDPRETSHYEVTW